MGAIDLSKSCLNKLKDEEIGAVTSLLALGDSVAETGTPTLKNKRDCSDGEKEEEADQLSGLTSDKSANPSPPVPRKNERDRKAKNNYAAAAMKSCFNQIFSNMKTPVKSQVTPTEDVAPAIPYKPKRLISPQNSGKSTSPVEQELGSEMKACSSERDYDARQRQPKGKLKPRRRMPFQEQEYVSMAHSFRRSSPPNEIPWCEPQYRIGKILHYPELDVVMGHCCANCRNLENEFNFAKSKITAPRQWAEDDEWSLMITSKTLARARAPEDQDLGKKRASSTSPSMAISSAYETNLVRRNRLKEAGNSEHVVIPYGSGNDTVQQGLDDNGDSTINSRRKMKKIRMSGYANPKECSEYVGTRSKAYRELRQMIEAYLKTNKTITINVFEEKDFTGTLLKKLQLISDFEWNDILSCYAKFFGPEIIIDLSMRRKSMKKTICRDGSEDEEDQGACSTPPPLVSD